MTLVAGAAVLAFAGCGGGKAHDHTRAAAGRPDAGVVRVTISDHRVAMPRQITGGLATLAFANVGTRPYALAMLRLRPGAQSPDIRGWIQNGMKLRSWTRYAGSVPPMTPGARVSLAERLRSGRYVLVAYWFDGRTGRIATIPRSGWALLTVRGRTAAATPSADVVLTLDARSRHAPSLGPGLHTLELRNPGALATFFVLDTLQPDVAREAAADPRFPWGAIWGHGALDAWASVGFRGPLPFQELGGADVVPPHGSVYLTTRFRPGQTYRFRSDRNANGFLVRDPHARVQPAWIPRTVSECPSASALDALVPRRRHWQRVGHDAVPALGASATLAAYGRPHATGQRDEYQLGCRYRNGSAKLILVYARRSPGRFFTRLADAYATRARHSAGLAQFRRRTGSFALVGTATMAAAAINGDVVCLLPDQPRLGFEVEMDRLETFVRRACSLR